MTLDEIKKAVDAGTPVYWKNTAYSVGKDKLGYFVRFKYNSTMCGLVYEGKLQGNEADFFTEETAA